VNHARIQPVRRASLRQTIHAALVQRILTGVLAPGSRINKSTIPRSLGVRPTPVREAFRDLYPVLAELEVMALKAAGVPPAEATDRLEIANKRFAAVMGRPDTAIQQDKRSHVARSHAQHREIVVALRGGRLDEALDSLRRNWLDSADELIAWLRDKEERKTRS
jgi:DNA-binding GntR family transcriptional regulator